MRIALPPEIEVLNERVVGAGFAVYNTPGSGFPESVFKKAMLIEMRERGLRVEEEVPFQVRYRGEPVGRWAADIVVEDRLIAELKATEGGVPQYLRRVATYLRVSGLSVGLLMNFAPDGSKFRRALSREASV